MSASSPRRKRVNGLPSGWVLAPGVETRAGEPPVVKPRPPGLPAAIPVSIVVVVTLAGVTALCVALDNWGSLVLAAGLILWVLNGITADPADFLSSEPPVLAPYYRELLRGARRPATFRYTCGVMSGGVFLSFFTTAIVRRGMTPEDHLLLALILLLVVGFLGIYTSYAMGRVTSGSDRMPKQYFIPILSVAVYVPVVDSIVGGLNSNKVGARVDFVMLGSGLIVFYGVVAYAYSKYGFKSEVEHIERISLRLLRRVFIPVPDRWTNAENIEMFGVRCINSVWLHFDDKRIIQGQCLNRAKDGKLLCSYHEFDRWKSVKEVEVFLIVSNKEEMMLYAGEKGNTRSSPWEDVPKVWGRKKALLLSVGSEGTPPLDRLRRWLDVPAFPTQGEWESGESSYMVYRVPVPEALEDWMFELEPARLVSVQRNTSRGATSRVD